jgi:hypothetical protein
VQYSTPAHARRSTVQLYSSGAAQEHSNGGAVMQCLWQYSWVAVHPFSGRWSGHCSKRSFEGSCWGLAGSKSYCSLGKSVQCRVCIALHWSGGMCEGAVRSSACNRSMVWKLCRLHLITWTAHQVYAFRVTGKGGGTCVCI